MSIVSTHVIRNSELEHFFSRGITHWCDGTLKLHLVRDAAIIEVEESLFSEGLPDREYGHIRIDDAIDDALYENDLLEGYRGTVSGALSILYRELRRQGYPC